MRNIKHYLKQNRYIWDNKINRNPFRIIKLNNDNTFKVEYEDVKNHLKKISGGETPSIFDSQTIILNTKNVGNVPHENVFGDCMDKLDRLSQMEIENEEPPMVEAKKSPAIKKNSEKAIGLRTTTEVKRSYKRLTLDEDQKKTDRKNSIVSADMFDYNKRFNLNGHNDDINNKSLDLDLSKS